VQGEVRFPADLSVALGSDGWQEVERVEHAMDARHAYAMSFVRMER
jgi:hypothetical protein